MPRLPPCIGPLFCNIVYSMKSINNIEKRKGRGRPATDATPILVRMLPDQVEALDNWIAKQGDDLGRPEAIRRLVDLGLKAKRSK